MDTRLRVHIFGNGTKNTEIVITVSNRKFEINVTRCGEIFIQFFTVVKLFRDMWQQWCH